MELLLLRNMSCFCNLGVAHVLLVCGVSLFVSAGSVLCVYVLIRSYEDADPHGTLLVSQDIKKLLYYLAAY